MTLNAKLQIKPDQSLFVVGMPPDVTLDLTVEAAANPEVADAVLAFVTSRAELETVAQPFVDAARRDALAWLAYPKGGKLGTDVNRDILWEQLSDKGIRPVRQVALDDTWSALRFRPAA